MRLGFGIAIGVLASMAAQRLTSLDVKWVKMAREREELNGACVPSGFWQGKASTCGWTEPTKSEADVLRDRDGGR